MPPFLPVILAGTAMYAAYRYAKSQVMKEVEEARARAEELRRRAAERAGVPRDLGALELDAETGVYRPRETGTP